MRIQFDPANLHESSKPITLVTEAGGLPSYYNIGGGSRQVFITSATRARVRVVSTEAVRVVGIPQTNTLIPYLVNGERRGAGPAHLGDSWHDLNLGVFPGISPINKRIEIITPIQNAVTFGFQPTGVYPLEIEFDGDTTIVAPVVSGPCWVLWTDSIGSGMFARQFLWSLAGLAKLGTSDQSHRMYTGPYDAEVAYLPKQRSGDLGQIVASGGYTWEKASNARAGTTPAVGSDWNKRGFIGRFVLVGWGARRMMDDINGPGAWATFAAQIAGYRPSRFSTLLSGNDHANNVPIAIVQSNLTGFLNSLGATSAGDCRIDVLGPTLVPSIEAANTVGETMDQMRSAIQAAAAMTTKSNVTYTNLKGTITAAQTLDQLHPGTIGHQLAWNAIPL